MPRNLDPTQKHPMVMPDGTVIESVVHLNRVIDHPRMEIGDFSYYSDFEPVADYAQRIAPYLFALSPERLIIGKFGQFAHGTRFVTSSANHDMSGLSTYPFMNFMMGPDTSSEDIVAMFNVPGRKGDTVVGNDVWIGMDAVIMPGVTIGDGAIVAARSVVSSDVAPFTIVGGNPARALRQRFDTHTINALLDLRWWDWDVDKIQSSIEMIAAADIGALQKI